jgi:hypothetical protein
MDIEINPVVKLFEDLEYVIQGYPVHVNNLDFNYLQLLIIFLLFNQQHNVTAIVATSKNTQ